MPNTFRTPMSCRGLLVATALAASLLAGCAAPGAVSSSAPAAAVLTPAKAEDAVRVRAQQRWDWLVTGKFDDAYTYTTPSYRLVKSAESYRNRFGSGAAWLNPAVKSVECLTVERCTVTVSLDVLVVARGFNKPTQSTLTETWLKEDGQWWFYQAP